VYSVLSSQVHITTVPYCSYNDLLYTFGNVQEMFQNQIDSCNGIFHESNEDTKTTIRMSSLNENMKNNSTTCCWYLKDSILRVPVSSIVNRNSLIRLGGGRKGGVYKAMITLKPNGSEHTEKGTNNNDYNSKHY
jgi:hypothetical protein